MLICTYLVGSYIYGYVCLSGAYYMNGAHKSWKKKKKRKRKVKKEDEMKARERERDRSQNASK